MSAERPNTPPPTQISHQSSSIKKSPVNAGHRLEQVQRYQYQKETHRKTDFEDTDDLFKLLGAPTFDELPDVKFSASVTRSEFLTKANSMSKSIKDEYFEESSSGGLVVFKDTESKVPRGHVTDAECKPDITAAFEADFNGNDTTFWPCIRMAGRWAPEGTPPEDQETKATSYLHYLLLARPDLYVAQGILASEGSMMFLVGIGGFGIQRLKIRWDDEELSKLLYAFIYRTYDPAHFADSSYKLDPIVDEDHRPTWSITIGVKSRFGGAATERPVLCPNFLPLYSSSPFGTRTHVFATMGEGVDVDGGKLTVLKDQVCHRFDTHEIEILELVHKSKRVPGVVEAVYHKSIELPDQLDGLKVGKVKHRHGLRQLGSPFATIPTVKEMLQVAFNIIEVLRFLRVKQNILHRDISPGNVMYAPPSGDEQDPDTSMEDEEVLYFSEYFLSDSPVRPQTTSALLVDFNHAKHLTSETDGFHEPVDKTGTPGYMARAIEQGRPVDIPQWVPDRFLDSIPPAPDRYAKHYRDTRLKKFPPTPLKKVTEMLDSAPWRHDLDHDVESVFWLMLDWAMTAQPKGGAVEYIDDVVWLYFTGSVVGRHSLLSIGLLHGLLTDGTCHSTFRPIKGLFQKLAGVLSSMDRHWLPASEERNDPEYFAEAFQRLILPFLIDHNRDDDGFMDQPIDSSPRQVERRRSQGPWASTSPSVSHN